MSDQPPRRAHRPTPAAMPRRRPGAAGHRAAPQPAQGRPRRRDDRGALAVPCDPPDPVRDHQAVAPYGLVPLPERPMPAERLQESVLRDGTPQERLLAGHDHRVPGTHTGWIDIAVRTLSPTFVGATRGGGRPERSLTIDGRAALPGASLRGLIRNTLRVLTGGETGPVNTPQLFFRAPAASHSDRRARHVMRNLNRQYRHRHGAPSSPPGVPVKAGFLHHRADTGGWEILPLPVERPLQVRLTDLRDDLRRFPGLPPFELPPHESGDGGGPSGYIPADFHGAFQYLDVVALCPDTHGRTVGESRFWAMAVLPPGTEVAFGHRETARHRLRERWEQKRARAEQSLRRAAGERSRSSSRGRRNDLDRALDRIDHVGFRAYDCVLVLTGVAGERKNAYLFPKDVDPARRLPVPDHLVHLVESADQITRFQERNHPRSGPAAGLDPAGGRPRAQRRVDGGLARSGAEPVWYQETDGRVVSFGRSGGYRVAVGEFDPVSRAVPEPLLTPRRARGGTGRAPDVPRALFGDLDLLPARDNAGSAARGRVSVGSAVCDDPDPWFAHPLRVELLSPQRSCFANYLLQPVSDRTFGTSPDLVTWSHEGDVRLGGYKVYLHRYDPLPASAQRYAHLHPDRVPAGATTRDVLPMREGLTFHGRITFTNLTDAELGALLRALYLGNPAGGGDPADPLYAHKIGLGKALGFGSVHISPALYLIDPAERACSLDPGAGVHRVGDEGVQKLLDSFGDALLTWEREESVRAGDAIPDDWSDVPRVEALLLAAQWRHRLPESWTRVMDVEEFAVFPVLPGLQDRFAAHAQVSESGTDPG
ncbi:TIGR03986 family CRISPR-associated RAMP protein [Streptomonospora nanhaiensis]|uniref:CRISPR-associated protein (TIGR03986 family) n=1 Tax=Streptomonospora nanhaiensis TaxID=1323731 RepID=A0A853BUE7_9ACTN|nr:TIGR03986 family CRISPR-associated RAMP protein [Streptomonospora nanhaiensis]MBV2365588.1 TIGR03986 family CRISPR-associated RAMP protein [Streptomonospora nanhaiensis]NYI98918.1 CRISPR-associated protein (TIGR03986 family) [Streptomonospora nanhaiensis]